MAATIRIGISGWRYEPWRDVFYPSTLPQRCELEYASRRFPTIEINGSFYSLQRPESYAAWYADTPTGFTFAVKGGRFITHMRKLRDVEEPLANFLASGLFNLREKLGPILWQFPPTFKYDRTRLEPFLELLPRDTGAASRLARRRFAWMKGRGRTGIEALERWARRIRAWNSGKEPADARKILSAKLRMSKARDVYCFFDNTDAKLRAPVDAQSLMEKLGVPPGRPSDDAINTRRNRHINRRVSI